MIKKLRVTIDGRPYDVTVEFEEEVVPHGSVHSPLPPPSSAAVTTAPAAPATPTLSTPPPAGPGTVPSPLSGRVTAINTAPGQKVNPGDHLLTLEAMKMNTFVTAPRAGTVKAVHVEVGSAVSEGQGLVDIE